MYNDNYSPQRFQILPPVCKNLLISNILIYFLSIVLKMRGIHIENVFGLHFIASDAFHFWQPLTYTFLHSNFSHLFFNMFSIWMFGYTLENIWGSKRFIIYCLIAALGAAVMQEATYYIQYQDLLTDKYDGVNIGNKVISNKVFLNH
ncbi:MAG: rhomboid family intramembrane serine protease, partial [Bacteroidales bacterium]|nr:rhomboid family intramembrane serine protease [Bacteroidales bacterium]